MKNNHPKEDSDFLFVEKPESQVQSIQLLKGKFKGLIYSYGNVKLIENKELGNAILKFDYFIEVCPEYAEYDADIINNDPEFKQLAGDILAEILSQPKYTIGKNGKQFTDDNS